MSWRQTIIAALVLALVAAAVVWYLERFNGDRLMEQLQAYLRKTDAFREQFPEPPGVSE